MRTATTVFTRSRGTPSFFSSSVFLTFWIFFWSLRVEQICIVKILETAEYKKFWLIEIESEWSFFISFLRPPWHFAFQCPERTEQIYSNNGWNYGICAEKAWASATFCWLSLLDGWANTTVESLYKCKVCQKKLRLFFEYDSYFCRKNAKLVFF